MTLVKSLRTGNIGSSQHAGTCMTIVLPSATRAVETKPVSNTRNLAFDRARSFIVLMVLLHHSVIPYTYYGHTDGQWFLFFDALVTFNDSYFMAAMFLLSGLFVWPSLKRKSVSNFLRGRWLRLGLPFAVGVTILMPIAYYAVEVRKSGPGSGFVAYWWKTVTVGPWESGPIWFLGVLLAFDMLAAAIYLASPGFVETIGRVATAKVERPAYAFWMFLAASVVAYVPLDFYFGIGRWFTLGPLAVQADRILLYLLYFFVGAGIGAVRGDRTLLSGNGELARQWPAWLVATLVTYTVLIGLIYYKREFLPDPNNPPLGWDTLHALLLRMLQRIADRQSARVVPEVRQPGQEHSRSLARELVWNLPDSLCPVALAAICTVRHHAGPDPAGNRDPQSSDRVRANRCDQLVRNARLAQDSRRQTRAVAAWDQVLPLI